MTLWQFIQAHSGAFIGGLIIVYGAISRALPAEAAEFGWGQFIIDVIKGVGQELPNHAPKLTTAQKSMLSRPTLSIDARGAADPDKVADQVRAALKSILEPKGE